MTLSIFGVVSQHSSLKNVHIVQNLFLRTPMRPLTKFTTYGLGDNLNLGSCHCFMFTSNKITVNSKEHIKVKEEAGGPVFVLAVMGGQLLYATAHGRQQFKGTYSWHCGTFFVLECSFCLPKIPIETFLLWKQWPFHERKKGPNLHQNNLVFLRWCCL